ncbi:MAG: phytoene/squalene synthase family protein [Candidatus Eiseniibacteriota bacterium]
MARHTPLSAPAELIRRYDHDRFLTVLFAPAEQREALFALYAFNLEVAKTREVVSEPLLGQIRLQWWREAIGEIYAGGGRRHQVIEPLARVIRAYDLPRAPFDRLIEARERDLEGTAPATLAALEDYAEATGGGLVELALHALSAAEPAALDAGRSVGTAWALTGLVRAVPFHARDRRQYLPAEVMAETRASEQDLMALRPTAPLAAAVQQLAEAARRHLAAARALRSDVPRAAVPALLPATLADLFLDRLARIGHDVLARPVEIGTPRRQLSLFLAAARGRY